MPRSQRRSRRTKAAMAAIRDQLVELVTQYAPMTVRQVFYAAVSRGLVEKSEAEYKQTVSRLLLELRRDGTIPYHSIGDGTRWMRKPSTYSGLVELLELTKETYRRAIWDSQDCYVEVWLEKDALAGVLVNVTSRWDVPLMMTRGYPSVSFLHSAGEAIAAEERPVYVYYFGDHDPSGLDIDRFVEKELRGFAPDTELTFQRVAVTPDQIAKLELPTRPTKKTDSRSKFFKGESVEVEAIDPDTLRQLCEECITRHVDDALLQQTLQIEKAERETLEDTLREAA